MSAKDTSVPAPVASVAGADVLTRLLGLGRPLVMGVLNVTPDSFSDGGRFLDPAAAIEQARRMAEDGADIIDIGAESTRPYGGAEPVDAAEERRRLGPVIDAVIGLGVPVSIDTMKAEVAAWALDRGASIANDVWGLQRDGAMAHVVAERHAPVVVMHNRDAADETIDILADIDDFFAKTLAIAEAAGIARDRLVLDPGIGFGKTPAQSLVALAGTSRLAHFGLPILVGASRKRFIDFVSPSPPDRRLGGSIAAHLLAVLDGARIVRVHDVAATVQALKVAAAIRSRK
ncbi:dihydropteroate synthase [Xanthobacteraceae bacterium Astr-EGSB]|uniref:dihydropteroate synthase n=1 Tax=Astrobacterium formosum TaxID=3069710 RepID=UPI0027B4F54F|nr:dihydropteroate synthase [Xanthobacteraceae bacterium Astr-EGSB]